MGHQDSGEPILVRDFLGIGGFVVGCVLIGLGLGWWADDSLGLTPVLTLVGLALGVAAGVFGTWRRLRPLLADNGGAGHDGAGSDDERGPH